MDNYTINQKSDTAMSKIHDIAAKYQITEATVRTLLEGLQTTSGFQVQFNIAELGGMGQWQSGMVMIGDMFNEGLKAKVSALCAELASFLREPHPTEPEETATEPTTSAAPIKTLRATFSGSQNGTKYAYYAPQNVLQIEEEDKIARYSTEGLTLWGVQQAQDGTGKKLKFTHAGGTITVDDLKPALE